METQLNMLEDWRPVPGFEGRYEVSRDGQVRRVFGGYGHKKYGVLRGKSNKGWFGLTRRRGAKIVYIHRDTLVRAAFGAPRYRLLWSQFRAWWRSK